ncbi:MAG: hypothetical protein IJW80_06550, partial [Alistipes sp.]|nr:hypothetical protein [Alistipes sp.]
LSVCAITEPKSPMESMVSNNFFMMESVCILFYNTKLRKESQKASFLGKKNALSVPTRRFFTVV